MHCHRDEHYLQTHWTCNLLFDAILEGIHLGLLGLDLLLFLIQLRLLVVFRFGRKHFGVLLLWLFRHRHRRELVVVPYWIFNFAGVQQPQFVAINQREASALAHLGIVDKGPIAGQILNEHTCCFSMDTAVLCRQLVVVNPDIIGVLPSNSGLVGSKIHVGATCTHCQQGCPSGLAIVIHYYEYIRGLRPTLLLPN